MSAEAPTIARKSALRQPMRLLANVLSLRYFVLRAQASTGFSTPIVVSVGP